MGILLIILVVAAIAFGRWRMSIRRYPYEKCRACGGTSRTPGSNPERFGRCRKCGGTGRQLRRGARA
jgi:DnaJ-class molecular chaperone